MICKEEIKLLDIFICGEISEGIFIFGPSSNNEQNYLKSPGTVFWFIFLKTGQ
jgi:hypothetical protein